MSLIKLISKGFLMNFKTVKQMQKCCFTPGLTHTLYYKFPENKELSLPLHDNIHGTPIVKVSFQGGNKKTTHFSFLDNCSIIDT